MKREIQNIEFKQTWRDEYLKWICGYANAVGWPRPNCKISGLQASGRTSEATGQTDRGNGLEKTGLKTSLNDKHRTAWVDDMVNLKVHKGRREVA